MTQRPKLRLSHAGGNGEKQPQTFVVADPPHRSDQARKDDEEGPAAPRKPAPKQPRKAIEGQQPTRLDAKKIAKTLLVVGALALSILLLKRRFF